MKGYNTFDTVALKKGAGGAIEEVVIGQGKYERNLDNVNVYNSFIHDLVAGMRKFGRVNAIVTQVLAKAFIKTFLVDALDCVKLERGDCLSMPSVTAADGTRWNMAR
ncbi:MAG: hypothetical protein Q6373_019850 [Candidatus Sigynarchaeota archaeon]